MPHDDLEPLITECPSCRTRFRVSEAQLERARGRVRCGACLMVFHGIEHLVLEGVEEAGDQIEASEALDALLDELAAEGSASAAPGSAKDANAPPEPTVAARRAGPGEPAPSADEARSADEDPSGDEIGSADKLRPTDNDDAGDDERSPVEPAEAPAASARARPAAGVGSAVAAKPALPAPPEHRAPLVFGEPFGKPRVHRPLVWLGIVMGLVLLALQVLWYQFDQWASTPPWRAIYAPICAVLGCELPVRQDVDLLSTRNLIVRSHPREQGALLVNAVIVNGADFPQPFPVLALEFTSVRGHLVAARRFLPAEYVAGDAEGMELIPPRTPVQIELTLDDPGPDAVNYRLEFH